MRRVEAGGSAYQLEFADRAAFLDYVNQAAADSLYPIDAAAEDAAGVLTLSTCTGRQGQRFLVQALLPAA